MKKLLIIALLVVGCGTEPEDDASTETESLPKGICVWKEKRPIPEGMYSDCDGLTHQMAFYWFYFCSDEQFTESECLENYPNYEIIYGSELSFYYWGDNTFEAICVEKQNQIDLVLPDCATGPSVCN